MLYIYMLSGILLYQRAVCVNYNQQWSASGGGAGTSEYVPVDYDSWALVVHTRRASAQVSQFSWLQLCPV